MPILEDDLLKSLYCIKLFLRNISKFNIFKILIFEFEIENINEKIDKTLLGYIHELSIYLQDILNNYEDEKFYFSNGPIKKQDYPFIKNGTLAHKDTLTIIENKVLINDSTNKFNKLPSKDNVSENNECLTEQITSNTPSLFNDVKSTPVSQDNNNESLYIINEEETNDKDENNDFNDKGNEMDVEKNDLYNNKISFNKTRNFKCVLCPREFLLQKHLDRHISLKHSIKCQDCNEVFDSLTSIEEYKNHKCTSLETNSSVEELPFFCCNFCANSFSFRKDFDNHICQQTQFDIPNSKRLITSQNALNLLRKLICGVCCEEYRSSKRMACHLQRCTQGPYLCEICKEEFSNSRLLTRHKKHLHKDVASFICPECGGRFKLRTSLQKHLVFRHERAKDQHTCDHPGCNESFEKRIHLTTHQINVHKLEKTFLCQDCGKQFLTKNTLLQHIRYHQNENRFKCTFCNRVFKQKEKLVYHMRLHTGERPHLCNQCGKRFIRKSKLEDHMRRHAGERIPCPQCPKTYAASWDLKLHIKAKHQNIYQNDQNFQSKNIQEICPNKKEVILDKCNLVPIQNSIQDETVISADEKASFQSLPFPISRQQMETPSNLPSNPPVRGKPKSAPCTTLASCSISDSLTTSSLLPNHQLFSGGLDPKTSGTSDLLADSLTENYNGDPNRVILFQIQSEYSQQTQPISTQPVEPTKVLFVDPSRICFMVEPQEHPNSGTHYYKVETGQDMAVVQDALPITNANPSATSGGVVYTPQTFEQTNFGF